MINRCFEKEEDVIGRKFPINMGSANMIFGSVYIRDAKSLIFYGINEQRLQIKNIHLDEFRK